MADTHDWTLRALRILLGFLALLMAIGGVVLVISSKGLILRLFMHPPESEITALLLAAMKEMGGLLLMLSAMLFLAARDPVRNLAVVDGLTVGLIVLAVTPLLSFYTTEARSLYPGYLIWTRSLGRLAFAGLVFWLRPREAQWKPVGRF